MTDAVPILIGITGKRSFEANHNPGVDPAEVVRARLRQVFAELDMRYPGTSKLLLTGGAQGTDIIAAQEALKRNPREWRVAVVLPFERSLFEKDFQEHGPRQDFRALLTAAEGDEPRVMVRTLPPLRTSTGAPATDAQLDRDTKDNDLLRHQHYEQVGQFIAEAAMIMIAVMDAGEQPNTKEANGGTARIVACRRAGRPDALGAEVARSSVVVRNHWSPLVAPPAGAVWLIDPSATPPNGRLPVTVLPPLVDQDVSKVYEGYPGRDLPPDHALTAGAGLWLWLHHRRTWLSRFAPGLAPKSERMARQDSHRLADGVHRFVRRHRQRPTGKTPLPTGAAAMAEHIEAMRTSFNIVQQQSKRYSESAFIWVAGMFIAAVLSLELFIEFIHSEDARIVPLGFYLMLLAGIATLVMVAQRLQWQPRAEDYRAVTEMLRVQKVWWSAGIGERVDRVHLQGVGADLLPIRDLARSLLGLVALRFDFEPCESPYDEWSMVRPPGHARSTKSLAEEKARKDWVGGQIRYFARNQEEREDKASHRDCVTWVLFTLSAFLALVLWLKLAVPAVTRWEAMALEALSLLGQPDVATLCWLLLASLVLWGRFRVHHVTNKLAARSLTFLSCLPAAGCLGVAIEGIGPRLAWLLHAIGEPVEGASADAAFEASKALTVITFVMMTAVAGAVRFATERLGLEAEALAYRDALAKFERAERFLAAAIDPVTGRPTDAAACRALIVELGTLALRENESWLAAHRERPLSPVVG